MSIAHRMLSPILLLVLGTGALSARQQTPATFADTSYKMPEVVVVGKPENLASLPGSANVLGLRALEISRPFTVNEAVRKLPGVNARDEEGFGLRPNLGIRGLNPTRSTKITLLEDGVPLAYAPYGDNASYYHPPIDRFERIELLKGAEQILFGPQTIGGIINYITPAPLNRFGGFAAIAGGSRGFFDGKLRLGGHRTVLDFTRKQGEGARDNINSNLNDLSFKAVVPLGASQAFTLRANLFTENSTVSYSGITEAEFRNFGPRYNPFKNDRFEAQRHGVSSTHNLQCSANAALTTNFYYANFKRDWWRQSSSTTDTQGGAAGTAFRDDRLAGRPVNVNALNSVQGRLRVYTTWGIEPRVRLIHAAFGVAGELHAGVKAHFEKQDRKQINGSSPTARTGVLAENNLRETAAFSAFLANRFLFGAWSVTPGLRHEQINSSRTNRLPGGNTGSDKLGKWIPSLGITWNPAGMVTLFTGVHRGFAPPRTEDVIDGSGTSTEVEAEESTNWELGARVQSASASLLQVTLFRNAFRRLIAVGSIAGGGTPLSQGKALFQGIELSGRQAFSNGLFCDGAYTWLPQAEQTTPFTQVVNRAIVAGSAAGKRQPYAPEHLLTLAAGYSRRGWEVQVETVHVGEQFADFANTVTPTDDGQRGKIEAYTIFNAALNVHLWAAHLTFFATVKNLADKTYIVDRTRGIQVGMPRLLQVGSRYTF
ncbi:MAG: TonB-dependent receptor [candidate division KSB1 bacterium]|nr:TonB-dependent receptor [candidate division KSB1 bacterium]MDZ7273874.1 TonB-dependent receptor [candidate division KSB1 bacterium]MDZ7286030.1 TonB-dependent receptor [candidate division KSB1 bacterium]MDZ7299062.1 TonB-dependent receptor [candidate division KSB1 bacterium]MDZ7308199.1 TonB-dependent receptor [candidate division KSB1 bacterium]